MLLVRLRLGLLGAVCCSVSATPVCVGFLLLFPATLGLASVLPFCAVSLGRARGPAPRLGVCIVKHKSAEPGFTTDVGCGKMQCGPVQDQFWFLSESLLVPPQAQHSINSIDIYRGAAYIPTHSPQHISLRLPTIRAGGIGS